MHRSIAQFHTTTTKRTTHFLVAAVGVLAFFSLMPTASATAIGTFNEANCGGGGVTVTLTTITWSPAGTAPGTGCIITGIGTSLTFSGGTLGPGVTGNIKNLTSGGGSVDMFMTFPTTPALDFVLDGFSLPAAPSNGTNCAGTTSGQTCIVVAGSPFLLTNNGNGTTGVGLTAFGHIVDAGVTSNWVGTFTTQLTVGPGTVQTTILGGGSEASTQSAQFTATAVPEPVSLIMIGAGLMGIALLTKKSKIRV